MLGPMPRAAPWSLAGWVQPPQALDPEALLDANPLPAFAGRVVLLHAFQMGCAGCRDHGLPQAERLDRLVREGPLKGAPLVVVGLHTPFDPSEPAGPTAREALRRFAAERGLRQALALDSAGPPGETGTRTFVDYGMQGTPTLCLIDGGGRLRRMHLGPIDDLVLGSDLGLLLAHIGRS
jgi:hypothetical protein